MTPVERQATARPVAYIRRSVEKGHPEDTDKGAGQSAEIAALAARKGETIAAADIESRDWGISGQREKRGRRVGMADILARIGRGEVTSLYAYAVDRLARDDAYALTIRDACDDAGVIVHTKVDGDFDFSNGRDRDYWSRLVTDAANLGRRINVVNADTKIAQRVHIEGDPATGQPPCDKPGRPHPGHCGSWCAPMGVHCETRHWLGGRRPYGDDPERPAEDPALVVAAYRDADYSATGATVILNARKAPPTRLGGQWTVRAVLNVLRAANAARAPMPRAGVSASTTYQFSGLLVCQRGHVLTTHTRRGHHTDGTRGPRSIAYRCVQCAHSGRGGRTVIAESKIRAWAIPAVAQNFGSVTSKAVERQATSSAALIERKMAALDAKLDAGRIDPATYRRDMAALRAKSAAVEDVKSSGYILRLGIDWSGASAEVNERLHAALSAIHLGPDLLPVSADWTFEAEADRR